jgi:hypothetical protein
MSDTVTQNDLETRVLALLENEQAGAAAWLEALDAARRAGAPEVFREWAAMAQERWPGPGTWTAASRC